MLKEACRPLWSGSPGLNWPQAEQREPMRVALSGHQLGRTLANTLGAPAAQEAAMIQEEPQQIQIRIAQLAAQREVVAESGIDIFDQRALARYLCHGLRHGIEDGMEL